VERGDVDIDGVVRRIDVEDIVERIDVICRLAYLQPVNYVSLEG
jgi:hypothetical protein